MKILLFANTDWYLYNFRLPLAQILQAQGHEVLLLSPGGKYVRKLRQAGFRWVEFRLSRSGMNPFAELVAIGRLVHLYRSEQPDLVHHFTIKCVLYGSVAARLAGVGAVVNAVTGLGHVFSAGDLKSRLLRPWVSFFYRLALRGTQTVFQNRDDLAAFIERRLACQSASHLIPGSGVDVTHFSPNGESRCGRTLQVLMAARLLWSKGVGDFVAAAQRVRGRYPQVAFLVAGEPDEGSPDAISHETLERWKIDANVVFLGHRNDMAALLRQVDLFVLPSYYGEGVPRGLIEAAASGLALVASDKPGCREIVRDGVNGLLVPARDDVRLAEAILTLLDNDRLRAAMGAKSREIACEEFSGPLIIEKTLQVYRVALQC